MGLRKGKWRRGCRIQRPPQSTEGCRLAPWFQTRVNPETFWDPPWTRLLELRPLGLPARLQNTVPSPTMVFLECAGQSLSPSPASGSHSFFSAAQCQHLSPRGQGPQRNECLALVPLAGLPSGLGLPGQATASKPTALGCSPLLWPIPKAK